MPIGKKSGYGGATSKVKNSSKVAGRKSMTSISASPTQVAGPGKSSATKNAVGTVTSKGSAVKPGKVTGRKSAMPVKGATVRVKGIGKGRVV